MLSSNGIVQDGNSGTGVAAGLVEDGVVGVEVGPGVKLGLAKSATSKSVTGFTNG